MQVQDLMTHDVTTVHPEESLAKAARLMADLDIGVLPVEDDDRLIGMVTDRDLAVRGLAQGCGPKTQVREVMTPDVIAANMADIQVRRLPVLNRDKRLVGILALCDIAVSGDPQPAMEALSGISRPTDGLSQMPVFPVM